jgi:alginate O-acetyltransferase complex protein AlgJ
MATRPAGDRLLIGLFLGALALPWAVECVRSDAQRGPELRESRTPSPKPSLELDPVALYRYPAAYENYFKDSFGLRDVLLRWHSRTSLELLGVTPTPLVLLGKQGWYFYTGDDSVRAWRGLARMSADELERWQQGLEARRDWLAGLGIDYLFVFAPNKETVYPEWMPDSLEKLGPTRLDQFFEYMRRNSDLDLLDMRPAFAAARAQDTPTSHLYVEEGTHWNARGALVAYKEIVAHLAPRFPEMAPLTDADWEFVAYDDPGDTWATHMYIGDLSRQLSVGLTRPNGKWRARTFNAGLEGLFGPGRRLLRGTDDPAQPRALLFHDSFGPFLENMLSEHFSKLECEWTYGFDVPDVLALKPRIVIELWVERTLVFHEPHSLIPNAGDTAQAQFERARQVCLRLDPAAEPPQVEAVARLKVEPVRDEQGAALRLTARSGADSLLLPPLAGGEVDRPLLHLSIDSPKDCYIDIFYLRAGDADYDRHRNGVAELVRGHNEVYLRLPEKHVVGRLRLRPAYDAEGSYLLRAFEVRSSAKSP